MAKGVLYVMTTVVPGIIKIGKTTADNFESRMYHLERNGYSNVVGLRRKFAIEVEDYDAKEKLLDEIFSKSNVPNSELFALDVDLVIQLLSSFEGKQIYPEVTTKAETFRAATEEHKLSSDRGIIPDGEYYLSQTSRGMKVQGTMLVRDGTYIVKKGAVCAPASDGWNPEARSNAPIVNNMLIEDVCTFSPSTAGWIILGRSNNGWSVWKDKHGNSIDTYRTSP